MDWDTQLITLGKVALAGFLAAMVGLEREWRGKAAGLRTHILAGSAAALIVALAQSMITSFDDTVPRDIIRIDPLRSLEAVVVGISFLGAGTIVFRKSANTIEGLTTAASILMVASVGISVALGAYALAVGVTALIVAVLMIVGRVEAAFSPKANQDSGQCP